MKLIGLVGEQAGGKGSFVSVLKEISNENIQVVSSSAILLEILKTLSIEPSRPNFKKLFLSLSKVFGVDFLTQAVKLRIKGLPAETSVVVYDSVRMPVDVRMVRVFNDSYLVYVTADRQVRYERARARKEKAGEGDMPYNVFLEHEDAENERYVPDIGQSAEFKIKNNGNFGWLQAQIADTWKKINKSV